MAFRRRKIKDKSTGEFIIEPVKCSVCKDRKAFTTMHGHYNFGGKTICDDCFPAIKNIVQKEVDKKQKYEMSEADYQTWGSLY